MHKFKILVSLIGFTMLFSPAANAQIGGLIKKVKKQTEETLNRKAKEEADYQLEKEVDKLLSGFWDEAADQFEDMLISALPKSKTTVDFEKGIILQEGKEDIKIRDNKDKPTDSEYVQYITISTMNLPDELAKLTALFGNASVQEIYLYGDRKMSTELESGTLTDIGTERFTYLNHETSEYWSQEFSEMFSMTKDVMKNVNTQMDDSEALTPKETEEEPAIEMKAKITVTKGDRKKIRGIKAQQHIVIVEMASKLSETDEEEGKFYMITDLWTAEKFAGSETLIAYDQRLGELMLDALMGSSLNNNLDFSGFEDPRMAQSLKEVSDELSEIEGMPIETNSYFVTGPVDKDLDLDAVLKGDGETDVRSFSGTSNEEPVKVQATMFSTTTIIANLTGNQFDLSRLKIPSTYVEIESPIKQYMEVVGNTENQK